MRKEANDGLINKKMIEKRKIQRRSRI